MSSQITATTSLSQLMYLDLPSPTNADINKWNTLSTPVPTGFTAASYTTKLGLWNADLSLLISDCAKVNACSTFLSTLKTYDGSALGALISFPNVNPTGLATSAIGPDNGFCFDSSKICVMGYYGSTGPKVYVKNISTLPGSVKISASTPTNANFRAGAELPGAYGFDSVSWASSAKFINSTSA